MKRQPHADTLVYIPSPRHILSSVLSSSPTHTRHTDPEGTREREMIYEITYARPSTTNEARDLRLSQKLTLWKLCS